MTLKGQFTQDTYFSVGKNMDFVLFVPGVETKHRDFSLHPKIRWVDINLICGARGAEEF